MDPIHIHTRDATVEDAAAIAAVDVASWRAAYRGLMPDAYLDGLSVVRKTSDWARSLGRERSRGKRTLVVEDDNGAVQGYATVGPDSEAPGVGLLFLMYVAPEQWGSGYGRALMGAAEAALRELGFARAVLWVLEANTRARRFYDKAAWRADGATRMVEYGISLNAMRYARAL